MIVKFLLNAFVFVALYGACYWAATHFYKDDPAAMTWLDREAYNKKFITKLAKEPNATEQQLVIQQLGGPDITEGRPVGEHYYQLLYYRTQRTISDGITTKTECTALLFIDRKLVSAGPEAEQKYYQATHHS